MRDPLSLISPSPWTFLLSAGAATVGALLVSYRLFTSQSLPETPVLPAELKAPEMDVVAQVEPEPEPEPELAPGIIRFEVQSLSYQQAYKLAIHRGKTELLRSLFIAGRLPQEPASHQYEVKHLADFFHTPADRRLTWQEEQDRSTIIDSHQCDLVHTGGLFCALADKDLTRQQRQNIVALLLENKANVNQTEDFKYFRVPGEHEYFWLGRDDSLDCFHGKPSVLSKAIINRQFYLVPTLLEAKADIYYFYPNESNTILRHHYMTPLSIACFLFFHKLEHNVEILDFIFLIVKARGDIVHAMEQLQFCYEESIRFHSRKLIEYKSPHPVYEQLFPRMPISKSLPPVYLPSNSDVADMNNASLFHTTYIYKRLEYWQLFYALHDAELPLLPGISKIIWDYLDDRLEIRSNAVMPFLGHSFLGQFLTDFSCYTMRIPAAIQKPEDQVCGYHKLKNLLLLTAFFKTYRYEFILMMREDGEGSWFKKIYDYCVKTRRHTVSGQVDLSYHDGFDFLQQLFSGKIIEKTLAIPENQGFQLSKLINKKIPLSSFTAIRIANDAKIPLGGAMGAEGLMVAANMARLALSTQWVEHPFALDMKGHSFTAFVVKEQKNYFLAYADSLVRNKNLAPVNRRIMQTIHQSAEEIEAYMRDIYDNHSDITDSLKKQEPKNSGQLEIYLAFCQQFLHFFRTYAEFFKPKTESESFFYKGLQLQAEKIKNCLFAYRFSCQSGLPAEIDQQIFDVYNQLAKLTPAKENRNLVGLFKFQLSPPAAISSSGDMMSGLAH